MVNPSERLKGQDDIENSLEEFIRIQSGKEETIDDPNSHHAITTLSTDIFVMLIDIEEKDVKKGAVIQKLVKNKDAFLLLAKCHPDQQQLRKDINDKRYLQLDVIMKQMETGLGHRMPIFSGQRHKAYIQWLKDSPEEAFAKDCINLAKHMPAPKANFVCPNLLLLRLSNLVQHKITQLSQLTHSLEDTARKYNWAPELFKDAITPMIKAMAMISLSSSKVSSADQADFAVKLVSMLQILKPLFNDECFALAQNVSSELAECLRMKTDLYKEISAVCLSQPEDSGVMEMTDGDPLNETVSELLPELWENIFPGGLPALKISAESISVGGANLLYTQADDTSQEPTAFTHSPSPTHSNEG